MEKFKHIKNTLKSATPEINTNTEDEGISSQYNFINELISKAEIPNELKQLIKQQEIIYIERDKLENKGESLTEEKDTAELSKVDSELYKLDRNTEYITNKIRKFIDENKDLRGKFEALIRELKGRRHILNPEDSSLN
jgi:hypothetical protein